MSNQHVEQHFEQHSPRLRIARHPAMPVAAVAAAVGLIALSVAVASTGDVTRPAPLVQPEPTADTSATGAASVALSTLVQIRDNLTVCFYDSLNRLSNTGGGYGVQLADPRCQRR